MEPTELGLILDSSVIIDAERGMRSVRQILEHIHTSRGETEVGISVVVITELTHGAYRAKTEEQRRRRLEFIDRLAQDVPVYPVNLEIALLAGRIAGESAANGVRFNLADLLIGATALNLGYAVATLNVRDFERLPGLSVIRL